MDEKYIRDLLSKIKCRNCGQQCEPDNVDVLGHQEDTWLFYTYCPSCQNRGLMVVSTKEDKKPQIAAELNEEEINKFAMPMSSDDVLDMHIFLKDFDGDFFSLFSNNNL